MCLWCLDTAMLNLTTLHLTGRLDYFLTLNQSSFFHFQLKNIRLDISCESDNSPSLFHKKKYFRMSSAAL